MNKHQITVNVAKEVTRIERVPHTFEISNGVRVALKEFLFPWGWNSGTSARNKVGAIKTIRAELGIGLKEAKDICDALTEMDLNGISEEEAARFEAERIVNRHCFGDDL